VACEASDEIFHHHPTAQPSACMSASDRPAQGLGRALSRRPTFQQDWLSMQRDLIACHREVFSLCGTCSVGTVTIAVSIRVTVAVEVAMGSCMTVETAGSVDDRHIDTMRFE
jgi:hypothetical protein